MDFIIGRESSVDGGIGRRLSITYNSTKSLYIGYEGSVPVTVSRQHCKLSVDADGSMVLISLKPANITYVNGQEIMKKQVSSHDVIELGSERYRLDLQAVLHTVADLLPKPSISIAHLETIWDNYQAEKVAMQVKRNKSAAIQSGLGILSSIAMVLGFFIEADAKNTLLVSFRIIFMSVFLLLSIYFFVIRYRNADKDAQALKEFEDRFKEKYVCPCGCGRFMGGQEYKQLVITQKMCPVSKRPYTI